MQSVLKIMPEPIGDVPRDSQRPATDGRRSDDREQFDSVYEEQLYQHQGVKEAERSRVDGNDAQRQRQQSDRQAANNEAQAQRDSKVDNRADQGADRKTAISTDDKAAKADKPDASKASATDDQAKSAVDRLVGVMENADKMLRQKNDAEKLAQLAASGELKHNKLAAAIDSVLAERDKDLPETASGDDAVDQLIKQSLKGDGKSISADEHKTPRTGGFKPSRSEIAGGLFSDTASGNSRKLDAMQTPGILPDVDLESDNSRIKAALDTGSTGNQGKTKPDIFQTPDILPDTDELAASLKTGQQIKGLGGAETPGINPKLNGLPGQTTGQGTVGKDIFQTPGTIPDSEMVTDAELNAAAQADKPTSVKPLNPQLTGGQGAQTTKNVFQTLDTQPDDTIAERVTRPFELAAGKGFDADKAVNAQAFKADAMIDKNSGRPSNEGILGDSDEAKNIIGTSAKNSSDKAAILNGQQAEAQKINPEGQLSEKQLNDKKMLESLAQQNQLKQEVGLSEERPAKFMPQENSANGTTKGPSQFTPTSGISASSSPVTNASTDPKLAAAMQMSKLNEAVNVNQADFSQNMKERLTIMMNKGVQSADIRLDPAELGQMQVKMTVENDVTSVSFTVQNAQAKEALEQAMPKLKEMLAEQGLEMGEGSVEQEDKQQQELAGHDGQGSPGTHSGDNPDGSSAEQLSDEQMAQMAAQQMKITNGALGGIDFFA